MKLSEVVNQSQPETKPSQSKPMKLSKVMSSVQEEPKEDPRIANLRNMIQNMKSGDGKPVKGSGIEYLIEDMNEKLDSKDPILSLEHNIANPRVKSLEDTPEYILRGLPEDVAVELYEKHSKPSYNWLTGKQERLFGRGGSMSAIRKAAEAARFKHNNPEQAKMIEEMSPNETFMVGMGEGFYSIGEGVGLLDKRDEKQREIDKGLHILQDGASVGKFTSQVAPFVVPAGLISNIASTPLRIAAGGGLGAAEGNIIARGEGGDADQITKATGLGFLIGTTGEAALPLINRMARKFAGKYGASEQTINQITINPDGTASPELQRILDSQGMTLDDLAEGAARGFDDPIMNAERKKAFDDLGLDITEAERTRNKNLWTLQQDAVRKEGPVSDLVQSREEQLDRLTQNQVSETGGIPQRSNDTTYNAVVEKSESLASQIDDLYKQARQQAPTEKVVKFDKALVSLKENAPSNEVSGGVVKALRDKMKTMGVIDKNWKVVGKVDLETSEQLRQYANRLSRSANGEGRYIIRQFKESLDDDVFKSMDELSKIKRTNVEITNKYNNKLYQHDLNNRDLDTLVEYGKSIRNQRLGTASQKGEIEDSVLSQANEKQIIWDKEGRGAVGAYALQLDRESKEIFIEHFGSAEKGIGKQMVNQIKTNYPDYNIYLVSSNEGRGFWNKMGVEESQLPHKGPVLKLINEKKATEYFKQARRAKADFEQSLDPSKANRFDKRKTSLVRDILDNKVKKDNLTETVLRRSSKYETSDLQELKKFLTSGSEEQIAKGQAAWNDIRSSALQQIKDEAFTGSMTALNTQSLSRAKLESALKKIGPKKLEVLFAPNEIDFLKKLSKVAVLKEPPPGTFTGSGPSSPAIQELQNEIRRRIPIFGDIFNAWIAKRRETLSNKLVLELTNDIKKIEAQNAKQSMIDFRKSKAGVATASVPSAATVSAANAEEEN